MFDLDGLPIAFGSKLQQSDAGRTDRTPLNQAMQELVGIIWKEGGFRFFHRTTERTQRFIYYCCQDQARERKSSGLGAHDVPKITRFPCQSSLTIRPFLEERVLALELYHIYHQPYHDRQLSPAVMDFIDTRITSLSPAEIFRDLSASGITGVSTVAQHQVYYRWQQANMATWRRHDDALLSAEYLLNEQTALYDHRVYTSGASKGVALYVRRSMKALISKTKELAMDSTFGTNNAGMDLFSILAEVDGTGIPLAYCFTQMANSGASSSRSDAGAQINLLDQFLRPLRELGFRPTFFGVDKDTAEISAVRQVWPETNIQLCYWHSKRALRTKLKDSKKTSSQSRYFPVDAQKLIPELEICWGSVPTRRPDGDHRYQRCQCSSRNDSFEEKGRMETSTSEEREIVMLIFCRHYNSHPLIPDQNGSFRSGKTIHRESASEMYNWCRSRNYFRLWAYLWINWYCPGQWELWARAANAKEIPKLKTTMIVESHWRRIKHDYLHRFNRPRIDLVVWVLTQRVIPDAITRMGKLLDKGNLTVMASWRKAFKREWKKLATRECDTNWLVKYHTNPQSWVCACSAFLESRFLICKHLVRCFEPIVDPVDFFSRVRRQRITPFWTHQQLVIRTEFKAQRPTMEETDASDSEFDLESETVESTNLLAVEDELEEDDEDPIEILHSALRICRDQKAKGNDRFLREFARSLKSTQMMVEEVTALQNRRSMPRTWARHKHQATMYYR